jgi:segregation and condensation protein B
MDEAPEGEDGHGMLEGEREQRLPGDQEAFPGLEQEPEIDDDTLMSMDKVDSVLSDFEQEFRRKPAADKDKQEAVASDESVAEQAETADNSPNDADGEDAAAENSAEDSQTRHD